MWQELLKDILDGDARSLARGISLVENEHVGYEGFMKSLPVNGKTGIIGITGPPGAGKSTLVDAIIGSFVNKGKKIAVLCVDPSSPFNLGAVLGDRIRMSEWYTNPNVFIRSLATRGSMGGLHPKIIEITDLVKTAGYDHIIVETVGVGQSEIEIAGLADVTVVVLVPEAGDEVQTMKSGLMEIADIFVVNKSDRPDADAFVKNLKQMLTPAFIQKKVEIPVLKTCASQRKGIDELVTAIENHLKLNIINERRIYLLAEKAYFLLREKKMKGISKSMLAKKIEDLSDFNLYAFVEAFN